MAAPVLVDGKSRQEEALRAKAQAEVDAGRFQWKEGDPWRRVDRAVAKHAEHAAELQAFGYGFNTLVRTANYLVALAYEGRHPDGERLRDYREARAVGLRRRLAGDAPWYKDLESARLASALREADRMLGPGNAFVAAFTQGQPIETAAERLIAGTHLDSAAERRRLLEGGAAAIDASTDPLIVVVRGLYPAWSRLQRGLDDVVAERERAHDEIVRVRAHLGSSSLAPDATGTLRFAFGVVKGYDRDGVLTPWTTTFHGLYDRHAALASHKYFDLPPRWKQAEKKLDLDTPLVFVTTVDIIGGSSGSPLVNRDGELVGVLFDGNLEELGNRFVYSDAVARSLAVDMRAMVEALDKVYGARDLLREIDAR
jgi:peptidase S46-like protein